MSLSAPDQHADTWALSRRGALKAAAGVMVGAALGPQALANPTRAMASTRRLPPLVPGQVGVIGNLKQIATGDLVGTESLEELLATPSVFGIGMLGGLDGELLIRDSEAQHGAFDRHHRYRLQDIDEGDIAFLVYASVPRWRGQELPTSGPDAVTDHTSLERQLPVLAGQAGLDTRQPFPFRLCGRAVALRWYVVGGVGNGEPSLLDSFLRARTLGGLDDADIEGVGFYNPGEPGIYTPPLSHMHIHFSAQRVGGARVNFVAHLEEILLAPGAKLYLPAPNPS